MSSASNSVLDAATVVVVGETTWTTAYADALRERSDATVRAVPPASAALDALRGSGVDCVATDYGLPETTGVDLVRRIRDRTVALPVILGTADGS